jgi:hypothetical protein
MSEDLLELVALLVALVFSSVPVMSFLQAQSIKQHAQPTIMNWFVLTLIMILHFNGWGLVYYN